MYKKLFFILALLFSTQLDIKSQGLWKIGIIAQDVINVDLIDPTDSDLRIIVAGALYSSITDYGKYLSAARMLIESTGLNDKDLILNSLSFMDNTSDPNISCTSYFGYQDLRGALGETDALTGMEYVFQNCSEKELKLEAVRRLALAGTYTHYDFVEQLYTLAEEPLDGLFELGYYGRSSTYHSQVSDLLADVITTASDESVIHEAIRSLSICDLERAIQLLEARYNSTSGFQKWDNYILLGEIDPENQPERSIDAISTELDATYRYKYIPFYNSILNQGESHRYLKPFFVKFVVDRLSTETEGVAKYPLREFLSDFTPIPPDGSMSTVSMFDELIADDFEIGGYGWVEDVSFRSELSTHLSSARSLFVLNQEVDATRELLKYQRKVDQEFSDGDDGDNKTITEEAWKFMHYESQYILDRLPGLTTIDIVIPEHWSMGSIPLDLGYYDQQYTLPGASFDALLWNGTAYENFDPLSIGRGFWIKYDAPKAISYYGLAFDEVEIPVTNGWNLVGAVTADISKDDVEPHDVTIASNYYGYEYGVGYSPAVTLEKGKGYWLKVVGNGSITIGHPSSPVFPPTQQPPPSPGAPGTPVLQAPLNGATGIQIPVTLFWYSSATATSYGIEVARDSKFTNLTLTQTGLTGTSKLVSSLLTGTKYYWHVNATNENGPSNWSAARSFTTYIPPPPPIPTLISPTNNATNVSVSPVVSWNVSSGATSYRLQVAKNQEFNPVLQDYPGLTTTSKVLATLSQNTPYWWKVNATNGNGTSGWSTSRKFTTTAGGGPCPPQSSLASLDEFTVDDSRGNRQRIYTHNGGRALELGVPDLEMPPDPPPGMFVARFNSRRFAEAVPANDTIIPIQIHVRDVTFPMTISWDLKRDNKIKYWLVNPGGRGNRIRLNGRGTYSIESVENNTILIEAQASVPCDPY